MRVFHSDVSKSENIVWPGDISIITLPACAKSNCHNLEPTLTPPFTNNSPWEAPVALVTPHDSKRLACSTALFLASRHHTSCPGRDGSQTRLAAV